jgi:UDP-GlcNAc:undecaprenyl-phosphate/decaprenyl-phosphate GlcNAc-1-phosphate transferase
MLSLQITSLFVCFVASAGLALFLTKRVRDFAVARGIVAPPELGRHIHSRPLPRLGGIAVYLSVLAVLFLAVTVSRATGIAHPFSIPDLLGLLGPATIIFFLGLYDDLHGTNAYLKFSVQAVAATFLYFAGYGVERFDLLSSTHSLGTLFALPMTVFWVLLITNAFNLIDGLDGLAAGSSFFSTMVIFVVSLLRGNFTVSFITLALAGAILGFSRYNFNPATIFLGDSGSLFIGFVLSALSLGGSQKATTIVAVAIPVVALGLPIMDVTLAVARRFLGGKRLFLGDDDHIHHKLLKRGFSQRGAVLILYAVTASFGILSLVLFHGESALALVLIVVAIGVLWGIQQLHYVEFSELSELFRQAGVRRRILANNVGVRRAAELFDRCRDRERLCKILQETFEPLGFDGFRLENLPGSALPHSSVAPMRRNSNGSLQYSWSGDGHPEPAWELRLQLPDIGRQPLAYISLFQMEEDKPLLFDLRVVTNGVRGPLSLAIQRTVPCNRETTEQTTESFGEDRQPLSRRKSA